MIENFARFRPKPPTLLSLLTLELEAFFEIERRKGRIFKYIDESEFSDSFFDINVRVLNHFATCVARFFYVCTPNEIYRGKLLSITHILNQLQLISSSEFDNLLVEIDRSFPAEFF